MSKLFRRSVLLLIAVVSLGAVALRNARGEVTRKELNKLFELGWQPGPEATAEAELYFDDLAKSSKFDARVKYAYVLVRIKQRKYSDALKLVREVLSAEPKNLHAWQTQIWLEVLMKDSGQALLDLDKLTELFPAEDSPDADQEETYRDAAEFCGRVFGYLDAPAASGSNEATRGAVRKKILARLTATRKTAFDEGRDEVTQKFLELTDEKLASKEKAKEEGAEEKEQKLKDLETEKEEAAKRESTLNERRDKLQNELKSELAELEKKDKPLAQEYNKLDMRAALIRNELQLIAADITRLQALANADKDPLIKNRYFAEIDRLNIVGNRYENDLGGVQRRGAAITNQRTDLQRRGVQAQEKFGKQIETANREISDLRKKVQQATGQEKRLKGKSISGETPQVRAKSAQAGAFVTYEPFPLEQERQRLLDSVR